MLCNRPLTRPPLSCGAEAPSTSMTPACRPTRRRGAATTSHAPSCVHQSRIAHQQRRDVAVHGKRRSQAMPQVPEDEDGDVLGRLRSGTSFDEDEGEEEDTGLASVPLITRPAVVRDDEEEEEEEWEEGAEDVLPGLDEDEGLLEAEVLTEAETEPEFESEDARLLREELARMMSSVNLSTAAKTQFERQGVEQRAEVVQARVLTAEEAREKFGGGADAGSKVAVIPDDAQLSLDMQGYQEFQMDGLDFLISETPDGRLDLHDTFYFDPAIKAYQRPTMSGQLPAGPRHLQVIPWIERRTADTVKDKPAVAKMKKVYMVGVEALEPEFKVKMDEVYCFQASTRILSVCEVKTIGTPVEPVLRIRAEGVTIEDLAVIPTPSEVSFSEERARTAQQAAEVEERLQREIEELEAAAEQMDELDDAPDVPESDMA